MQKKLTITIDQAIYNGLHNIIGRGHISQFIESLLRPHLISKELQSAYKDMARDQIREREAQEWTEELMKDMGDESR